MGKGTNTTTNTTAPNPAAMQAYSSLMERAGGVASTPYAAYTGELTAPINAQQNLGIGNINANAGFASPYIQQAAGYATDAARPISGDDIARYQNPYTQQVVDATQQQFARTNAQQQEGLKGRAIAQGALGGSRAKIASADMAYQQQLGQAPVIAGLYDKAYGTALSTAQQQQQNLGSAAYSIGNLGVAGQNAALTGAGAQVGAGSLEQQNEQQRLAALYQQYQIAQAFPYQQTQWLAGINTGVGSQMGGTSTTTPPTPNPWSQVAGLGLAAAGAYFGGPTGAAAGYNIGNRLTSARGGGIPGFDAGGSVGGDMPFAGVGWIPQRAITMGRGAPPPPGVPAARPGGLDTKSIGDLMGGRRTAGVGAPIDLNAYGSNGAVVGDIMPPAPQSGLEPIYRYGGGVHGFAVGGSPMAFDDRWGPTTETMDDGTSDPVGGFGPMPQGRPDVPILFADRWAPASDAVDSGTFDPVGSNNTSAYAFAPEGGMTPMPRPRPDDAPHPDAPPEASWQPAPREGDPILRAPTGVTPGLERDFAMERPAAGVGAPAPVEPQGGFANLSMPLMAAGLGMMASRSGGKGSFLQAAGEGGLSGLNVYAQQKQQAIQTAERAKRLELDARRLDQAAEQSRKLLEVRSAAVAESGRYHDMVADQGKYKPIGSVTEDGHPILIEGKTGQLIDGVTRKPIDPAGKIVNPKGGGLFDDETIKFSAEQILAGDKSPFANLGRGAQGPENIAKLRAEVMRQAKAKGIGGADLAALNANFSAQTAAAVTAAKRESNVESSVEEAKNTFPLALDASKMVPRTQFVPLNRAIQAVQSGFASPELARFVTANQGVITAYSQAMSRTGVNTVHAQDEAKRLLSTATTQEAYEAVLDQMKLEMAAAQRAPETVRKNILDRISGRAGAHGAPPPAAAAGDVPKGAIDKLRANPSLAPQFDEKFGAGAASRILGQ